MQSLALARSTLPCSSWWGLEFCALPYYSADGRQALRLLNNFQVGVTPFHLFKIILVYVPMLAVTGLNARNGIIFARLPPLFIGLSTGTLLLVRLSMELARRLIYLGISRDFINVKATSANSPDAPAKLGTVPNRRMKRNCFSGYACSWTTSTAERIERPKNTPIIVRKNTVANFVSPLSRTTRGGGTRSHASHSIGSDNCIAFDAFQSRVKTVPPR